MSRFLVITTIDKPNDCLKKISNASKINNTKLVIIGDKKSPLNFKLKNSIYLSLKKQSKLNFSFTKLCPENSYARKNIGYLYAMKKNAKVIFETDDDNEVLDSFFKIKPFKYNTKYIENTGWLNIYKYFSSKNIWPRGFPLEEINLNKKKKLNFLNKKAFCPINQRLADENPDVDAVYRLTKQIPFYFEKFEDLALGKNCWFPFNSQNTVWRKEAFQLMYLPSHCSFRLADIWRSFVAQRICWENDWNVLHSNSTVIHKRNDHNLMKDFRDEIPGYLNNYKISQNLNKLNLKKGTNKIPYNLIKCYENFCKNSLVSEKELILLDSWIKDVENLL